VQDFGGKGSRHSGQGIFSSYHRWGRQRYWKISRPTRNLDGYKSAWNKAETKKRTSEDEYSKKPITPHTRIKPWNEDTANKWFMRITEEMSKKTENAIYKARHWTRKFGLIAHIERKAKPTETVEKSQDRRQFRLKLNLVTVSPPRCLVGFRVVSPL
jgi:hypothetical protein